ncbi:MAG: FAD-dependent oxidoreductase [Actinomycetaceae bacterium]|nr:FAD-dependent oxidoreductase [Actinomycetaceae bacterium]
MSAKLDPASRRRAATAFAEKKLDLLIIGGGITGAGLAFEAASRGLKVGLVEAADYGSGLSSRTGGLINGGIPWDGSISEQALMAAERGVLTSEMAPHLVKLTPFLWSLRSDWSEWLKDRRRVGRFEVATRFLVRGKVPPPRHYSRRRAASAFTSLRNLTPTGAVRLFDACLDSGRLTVTTVRSAAALGAVVLSHAQALSLARTPSGRIAGAIVRDETGWFEARAHQVVLACGPGAADTLLQGIGIKPPHRAHERYQKGTQITVSRSALRGSMGLYLRAGAAILSFVPEGDLWIIGPYMSSADSLADIQTHYEDVKGAIDLVNDSLKTNLRMADVNSAWSGVDIFEDGAVAPVREFRFSTYAPGLSGAQGGPITTFRAQAAWVVDRLFGGRSVSASLPLLGASQYASLWNSRYRLAAARGLSARRYAELLNRYGDEVKIIFDLIDADPSLGQPFALCQSRLRAEAVFAVLYEGAFELSDVLHRRLNLAQLVSDGGNSAGLEVAELVRPYLGWDDQEIAAQVAQLPQWDGWRNERHRPRA